MGMNWKKVERVRWSIEKGDYTHPARLISSIETDFDRFSDQLLCDINEPAGQARETAGVSKAFVAEVSALSRGDCLIRR